MTTYRLSRTARITAAAIALAILIPAASLTTGCFVDRRQVVETQRSEAFDLFTQGQELERRGDLGRALEYYSRAAEVSPRPAFYARAGSIHAKLGQHAQAVHFFDLALQLNPAFDSARAERDLSIIALQREEETLPPGTPRLELADVLTDPAPQEPTPQAAPPTAPNGPIIADAPEEPTQLPAVVPPSAPDPGPAWETPVSPEPVLPSPIAPQTPAPLAPAQPAPEPAAPPVAPISPTPTAPVAPGVAAMPDPFQPDFAPIQPGDLPPRRVRAAGELIDREQLRTALFSHVSTGPREDLAAEREAARIAYEAQRWDEATRRWEHVASLQPDDVEARLRLADSLQRSGRNVRAWEAFDEAARLDPANPTVHREWGNSLVRAGELDRAAERYSEVVRLAPNLVEVRNNLAAIDIERNRAPQAVRDLEAVLDQRPDFAPAWLNLAIALERTGGDSGRQISALETYLQLDGTRDAEVERWIAELRSARR